MPITSRNNLRLRFENGDIPNQDDYTNVFDSFIHKYEDGIYLNTTGEFKVGIGTGTPTQTLHIEGHSDPAGGTTGIRLLNRNSHANEGWTIGQSNDPNGGQTSTDGRLSLISESVLQQDSIECLTILPDGTVGIGTVNPSEKLEVNGAIKVGNTLNADSDDGTIRYASTNGAFDLEVRMGGEWVSLTQGNGGGAGGVSSVNALTGNVILTTDNISDSGNNNLYFTNARAIAANFGTYAADTGIINGSDSIKSAIQKLDGNKVAGTLPATTGQIPHTNGTANTLTSSSNFAYSNGTLNVTRTTSGASLTVTNQSAITGGSSTMYIDDGGGGGLGLGYGSAMYISGQSSNGIILQGGGYYGVLNHSGLTNLGNLAVGFNDKGSAVLDLASSVATKASLRIRKGDSRVSGNDGDIWYDNSGIIAKLGSSDSILSAWTKGNTGINYSGGNVGIGVNAPVEKLELNGAIKVGNTVNEAANGTIRYSDDLHPGTFDLEVKTANGWISLTASNNPPVSLVNGQSGTVVLNTDHISDNSGANTNKYFSNALAIAATLSGFNTSAASAALTETDSIKMAIEKLNANDKTKLTGSLSTTQGLIPYSSGTANTVTTTSNLSFVNTATGGQLSVGLLVMGSDMANHNFIQSQNTKFSLLAAGSASKIELYSDGKIIQSGQFSSVGKSFFGRVETPTAYVDIESGDPTTPGLRMRPGADVIAPDDGAIWYTGTSLKSNIGGAIKELAVWDTINGGINYGLGKVGVGISSPVEKLEVNGAIKVGPATVDAASAGIIEYKGGVFRGRKADGWQTFGSGNVVSVNGQTETVSLTTSHISEGGNLYFTNQRGISATLSGININSTPAPLVDNDTVMLAFEKLNANINAKISSQWVSAGDDIYFPTGRVGIGGTTVSLTTENYMGKDILKIVDVAEYAIRLFRGEALTTANNGPIESFDPGLNEILSNMRQRINELESRLQTFGLL